MWNNSNVIVEAIEKKNEENKKIKPLKNNKNVT